MNLGQLFFIEAKKILIDLTKGTYRRADEQTLVILKLCYWQRLYSVYVRLSADQRHGEKVTKIKSNISIFKSMEFVKHRDKDLVILILLCWFF